MRTRILRSFGWALGVTLLLCATARADGAKLVATGADRIAIKGYDTVAYFTDGKATKGSSSYEYIWDDAKWRFASLAHRDLFIADPDRYAPQFGGFCAGAIVNGVLVPANPESWAIVDGKLYMVAGPQADIVEWKADAASNIQKANEVWPGVQNRSATQNQ